MALPQGRVSSVLVTGWGAPELAGLDPILVAVGDALAPQYEVLGLLGRDEDGRRAILAREPARRVLRVVRILPGAAQDEVDIEILDQLHGSLPADAVACPMCHRKLRVWGRFCTRCGEDLSGVSVTQSGLSREQLCGEVERGLPDDFQLLGAIARAEGGGDVYFAKNLSTGELVSLRLDLAMSEQASREFTVGVTSTLRQPAPPQRPAPPTPVVEAPKLQSLLEAAQRAVQGQYTIHGVMGHLDDAQFLLATELASRRLVALRLVRGTRGPQLSVFRRLDDRVAATGMRCDRCDAPLERWAQCCPRCGTGQGERIHAATRPVDMERLAAALGDDYTLLGPMDTGDDERRVYFAKRVNDGAIVGIRADQLADSAIKVRETGVMRGIVGDAATNRADVVEFARHEPSQVSHEGGASAPTGTPARIAGFALALAVLGVLGWIALH